jgi:hypothetical protein
VKGGAPGTDRPRFHPGRGSPDALFIDLARDVLARGHRIRFRARGHSMTPTVRDGEAILAEAVDGRAVVPGDLVLCAPPRGLVAHRVRALVRSEAGDRLLLRGDAASTGDPLVAREAVLARVVAVERSGRLVRVAGRWARRRDGLRAALWRVAWRFARAGRLFPPGR